MEEKGASPEIIYNLWQYVNAPGFSGRNDQYELEI